MIHKFDASRARRVYGLPAVAVILLGGSIALLVLGLVGIGIAALVIGGWISYHLIRYTVYQFKSQVRLTDDQVVCVTSMGYETGLAWSEVTHAGSFMTKKSERYIFLYSEPSDELLSIPPFYSDQDTLEETVRNRVNSFLELSGAQPDDLAGELKPYLEG